MQATQMYFDQKHLKRNWKQLKLAQMKMYLLSDFLETSYSPVHSAVYPPQSRKLEWSGKKPLWTNFYTHQL